ncbi:MAG: site-2 protease family protein [Thermoguttaceae bacterium]|jgi:membrane-associated protease RseP (regulator of RpoE activity)
MSENREGEMSEYRESEPKVFPAELVEIVPAAGWQFEEPPPQRVVRKRRVWLPVVLFFATCFSTFLAGILTAGDQPTWSEALYHGMLYAVPLMIILVCHEMGHFVQAWRNGVYASFPYFIPMPASLIGTMGAVIAMEARMGHRRALFDIGITGPLAGLIPTIICCAVGLYWSVPIHGKGELGDPLLFKILIYLMGIHIPPGYDLLLHPLAFAGWVGLLITSLNLIPIGQLDGGHVLYALLRKKANVVARILLALAAGAVVFFGLYMWILMIFLLIMMGPSHPPTADDEEPLGWPRIILGWLTLAFIPFGFTPIPFSIGQ